MLLCLIVFLLACGAGLWSVGMANFGHIHLFFFIEKRGFRKKQTSEYGQDCCYLFIIFLQRLKCRFDIQENLS